jgi:NAD(P)H dehydrogenase (quinone)
MFVILGATGKVGRATITALRKAGAPVRAVVRDRAKAQPLAELGCEIAMADMLDASAVARAIEGASAVQMICPVNPKGADAAADMQRAIESVGEALQTVPPPVVLAISDYGAEVESGTGVTWLFHVLEERLRRLSSRLIFLRSAEHMQNWARMMPVVIKTGSVPCMHHPLTKLFPTVSTSDVGAIAAELLLSPAAAADSPRIVHVEGPRRYTSLDVAEAMSSLFGRKISAHELPRTEWESTLLRAGPSESYVRLIAELFDAHNAGRIDAEPGVGEIRRGPTELVEALKPLVPAR